tara:strand:- start:149 stop:310 length:162 start_codon:yes stop_codon:yes gene_type:complete
MEKYGTYSKRICKNCGEEHIIPHGAEEDVEIKKVASIDACKHEWLTVGQPRVF